MRKLPVHSANVLQRLPGTSSFKFLRQVKPAAKSGGWFLLVVWIFSYAYSGLTVYHSSRPTNVEDMFPNLFGLPPAMRERGVDGCRPESTPEKAEGCTLNWLMERRKMPLYTDPMWLIAPIVPLPLPAVPS